VARKVSGWPYVVRTRSRTSDPAPIPPIVLDWAREEGGEEEEDDLCPPRRTSAEGEAGEGKEGFMIMKRASRDGDTWSKIAAHRR
jgi:hypothetical protein